MKITKTRLRSIIREELSRTRGFIGETATMGRTDPYEYEKRNGVWYTRAKNSDDEWISLAGNEEAIARLEGEDAQGYQSQETSLRQTLALAWSYAANNNYDDVPEYGDYTPVQLILTYNPHYAGTEDDPVDSIEVDGFFWPDGTSASKAPLPLSLKQSMESYLHGGGTGSGSTMRFRPGQSSEESTEAFIEWLSANQPHREEIRVSLVDDLDQLNAALQIGKDTYDQFQALDSQRQWRGYQVDQDR